MIIDIPTALTELEAKELIAQSDGKRVVEAGALLGFSTIHLAQRATHVISIDRHEGYNDAPTLNLFTRNLHRYRVNNRVQTVQGNVLDHIADYEADFAFIDLTGKYQLTKDVLNRVRARVVGVH